MASDTHETLVCEHGREIKTCRCRSDMKTLTVVPHCPFGCYSGTGPLHRSQHRAILAFAHSEAMEALPLEVQAGIEYLVRTEADRIDEKLKAARAANEAGEARTYQLLQGGPHEQ